MSDIQDIKCAFPMCKSHPQKNGYCISHTMYANHSGEIIEANKIDKKTKKLAKQDREYKKIVVEMLEADPLCEMHTPVCTNKAEGLHHMKRRGVNLLNRKYLKRSCNACNGWVEKNPREALQLGLSVSVHKKEVA